MKKGEIYEGVVERIDFPNKGRVHVEGETVTVKNAIPGQKIRFQINKKRKNRMEGRLLEVTEKSPMEKRDPVCSIFPSCGGCMYQTMSYEDQLAMKAGQVKKLLDDALVEAGQVNEAGEADYPFLGIKGSPKEFAYRNKMEFSFGDEYKDGPLSLGLHKKGSTYDVLTACDCKIVHDDFTKILTCVLAYFKERNASYYHKISHEGYLRHLLVRRAENTGEILVNLVTTSQEEWDLMPLVQEVLGLPLEGKVVGFLHIINDSLADIVKSDETKVLYGQDYFYEELLGLKFKITPFSFFQTNSLGAEVLYSTAREFVGETKDRTIFDLYSGTGTIAQILAPVAKEVIGVEIVEEAVTAAKENAEANGLTNCSFLAGDVLKVIDQGADDSVNAVNIKKLVVETTDVEVTEKTQHATLVQSRHRIPEQPLSADQILVLQVPMPEPLRNFEPSEAKTRVLHAEADYTGAWFDQIVRYGHTVTNADHPCLVEGRYVMAPSPIPRFDTMRLNMAQNLTLLGAGREKKIYAVPPFTHVHPLDFEDYPFAVESFEGESCRLCGATDVYLDELVDEETGETYYQCNDTAYCQQRREEGRNE